MRKFFTEGDMIVAEAQAFFQDGAMSMHTRSLKYGKLRNGVLVVVPPSLVLRSRSHFHTLANSVEVIMGLNGYIWVSKRVSKTPEQMEPDELYADVNEEVNSSERDTIARIVNCLRGMADRQISIDYTKLAAAYEASLECEAKELLQSSVMEGILDAAMSRI
jgi:exosome complex component RRP4